MSPSPQLSQPRCTIDDMTSQSRFGFSRPTHEWFAESFGEPTPAQAGAWKAVAEGDNALVVAPTGSGKTLAAFLWSLDRLATAAKPADPQRRCRVLYVSPLKALAYDVERNLRSPLAEITAKARRLQLPVPDVTVAMRTGDTPAQQRRSFARAPADILITTPESLYLLLTSAAREALRGIDTVIVDEVHAMCGGKRGAHLALSLERLDAALPTPAQRIGLSATVKPAAQAARFLGGSHPVTVVQPPANKTIELSVEATAEFANLTDVDEQGQPSVWPSITRRLHELISSHRSTIVFANSRLLTERLCARLNELAADASTPHRSQPAQLMAQSEAAAGAPAVMAKAHHGSMSREERLQVESGLKSGTLPAVVSTSSLELGIDMGAVDLVVQLGAPPSVASGVQRVGRSGHHVGAVSRGVVLPTHQADLLAAAVTAERMQEGDLEELHVPRNPLDVLAQQVVAAIAMDDWNVADLGRMVRRAAPFADLPEAGLHDVLDMVSGHYPSTGFAGLKPKLVWDRDSGRLSARRGAQRLAVLNAGTIPDRGLYGVFLESGGHGARVGELDEEMVYESRVGDVFLLGATSWRIESITADRVLVSPAPGQPARMPFWKGEDPGRPAELGKAVGARLRELSRADRGCDSEAKSRHAGLDEAARSNLSTYVSQQLAHAGRVCDDRTVVMERFRDQLGDWRVAVHCVLGARVNRPWALAIAARLRDRHGVDGHVSAADDGIMLRLPDMDEPPGAELLRFSAAEIDDVVTAELGGSALYSARFRECAARALVLPRRGFGRRQPLWQQRHRAGQLFAVARDFANFPVTAEAARECLEDYFDMAALQTLLGDLAAGSASVVETAVESASPFTRSLLSAYVAENLYGEDEPLAERRAAALNSGLLDSLLGEGEQTLDPDVVAEAQQWLQWQDGRELSDVDDVAELLRVVGELSESELAQRGVDLDVMHELEASGRAVALRLAGQTRYVAVEDAARYRDGLGVELPADIPKALLRQAPRALDDLLARYARTRGPFRVEDCARRLGADLASVEAALHRLDADGTVTHGTFTAEATQWCSVEVLRLLRRKTLAALRAEIAPAPTAQYTALLAAWQGVNAKAAGAEATADALAQLQGTTLPGSAVESLILPARVDDYSPAHLDELTGSGELLWAGDGRLAGKDGFVRFAYAETAPLLLPLPDPQALRTDLHRVVLDSLEQAQFFRDLVAAAGADPADVLETLWDLVWSGWVSNDSLAPLRARLHSGSATSTPRPRSRRAGRAGRLSTLGRPVRSAPPAAAGRWIRLPPRETDATVRAHAAATSLLDRDGIVVRGAASGQSSGFAGMYPVLSAMEEKGAARRGYFVSGLGAAQFAAVPVGQARALTPSGAVDRLRSAACDGTLLLSACDPANPYGSGLAWPTRADAADGPATRHRPGRRAGAAVILVDGELCWFVERGGRTVLTYAADPARHRAAAQTLATTIARGGLPAMTVTQVDGRPVGATDVGEALAEAGFRVTPKGLRA